MNELKGKIQFKKFSDEQNDIIFHEGINIIYGDSGVGKENLLDMIQKGESNSTANFDSSFSLKGKIPYRIYQNPEHQIIAPTIRNELTFSGECKQLTPDQLDIVFKSGMRNLPDYFDQEMNPGYLSGGEKEILNLVTALDHSPDILLIHDALSFLSDANKEEYVRLIKKWTESSGGIVIWVTSEKRDVLFGDYNYHLNLNSFEILNDPKIEQYDKLKLPQGRLFIAIKDLDFQYLDSRLIFSKLNLSIENARSLGLVGQNGSGKTTLSGLCFGDLKPSKGTLELDIVKRMDLKIGYLDQFPEHTILMKSPETLLIELKKDKIFLSSMENTFKKRLLRFGIRWDNVKNQNSSNVSWTVLRILLLVLMCHCQYDVLILDEPTFGLGWDQRVQLRSFIRDCMNRMHFIIVSHDREFTRSICDAIIDFDHLEKKSIKIEKEKETQSQG